jgi:hypothetical protein
MVKLAYCDTKKGFCVDTYEVWHNFAAFISMSGKHLFYFILG